MADNPNEDLIEATIRRVAEADAARKSAEEPTSEAPDLAVAEAAGEVPSALEPEDAEAAPPDA